MGRAPLVKLTPNLGDCIIKLLAALIVAGSSELLSLGQIPKVKMSSEINFSGFGYLASVRTITLVTELLPDQTSSHYLQIYLPPCYILVLFVESYAIRSTDCQPKR